MTGWAPRIYSWQPTLIHKTSEPSKVLRGCRNEIAHNCQVRRKSHLWPSATESPGNSISWLQQQRHTTKGPSLSLCPLHKRWLAVVCIKSESRWKTALTLSWIHGYFKEKYYLLSFWKMLVKFKVSSFVLFFNCSFLPTSPLGKNKWNILASAEKKMLWVIRKNELSVCCCLNKQQNPSMEETTSLGNGRVTTG